VHPITTAVLALATLAGGGALYLRGTRPVPRNGWSRPAAPTAVALVAPPAAPQAAAPPHAGAGTTHAPSPGGGAVPAWSPAGGPTPRHAPAGPAAPRPHVGTARVPHTGVFTKGTGKPARAAPAPTHAKLGTHHAGARGTGHGRHR
jgi:hypothetical protein